MHYTELLRGVNALASNNQNQGNGFPIQLYPEETFYLDALENAQPITNRAVNLLRRWNRRVHINEEQLQIAYGNVPNDVLNWNLEDLSLWEHKIQIIERFSEFIVAVRYTGASKALHILNPRFFMMWDGAIRRGYGCCENEEGYFNFLLRSQREIQEVISTYTNDYSANGEISQRIYAGRVKSILRLLDEYNFARYRRQWI
jgi:hypothetical protein